MSFELATTVKVKKGLRRTCCKFLNLPSRSIQPEPQGRVSGDPVVMELGAVADVARPRQQLPAELKLAWFPGAEGGHHIRARPIQGIA